MRRLLTIALFTALCPLSAGAACELHRFQIPVTMKGRQPVASMTINDRELQFLLDSGAFYSTLSRTAATELGLPLKRSPIQMTGVAGDAETSLTQVRRVKVGNAELTRVDFLVGGNHHGGGTVGIMGRNLLGLKDTEYDLANGAVRLVVPKGDCKDRDMAYWAGGAAVVEVPLVWSGEPLPPILADASINGKPVRVLFDTGATSSFVTLKAAKRVGLISDESSMKEAGTVRGFGRGELPYWTVPLPLFELGGERITNVRVNVSALQVPQDMILGMDYFLSHRILVARSQDRLYFTYLGGTVFDVADKPAMSMPVETDADASADPAVLARRAAAAASRGELLQALAQLDGAVELAPDVAGYRAQRAQVRRRLHQWDAALADVDEALRLDPNADEVRLDRAAWRTARGDAEGARADLALLDQRLSPQAHQRRRMGRLLLQLHDPLAAERQLDQWVKAYPQEVDLHAALAQRCRARALANVRLDEAQDDCDRALKAQPQNAEYLGDRGLLYLRRADWKRSIADYDIALERTPDAAWSLWGRGLARLHAGLRDDGLADLAAARAKSPTVEADAIRHGLGPIGDAPTAAPSLR